MNNIFTYLGVIAVIAVIATFIFSILVRRSSRGLGCLSYVISILLLVLAVFLFVKADRYRADHASAKAFGYYEKGISYTELTNSQRKDVDHLLFVDQLTDEEKEQYRPAVEYYVPQFYEANGLSEENAKSFLASFFDEYEPYEYNPNHYEFPSKGDPRVSFFYPTLNKI